MWRWLCDRLGLEGLPVGFLSLSFDRYRVRSLPNPSAQKALGARCASMFQPTTFVWWSMSSMTSCAPRPTFFSMGRWSACDHLDGGNGLVLVRWQTRIPLGSVACSKREAGLRDKVNPGRT